MRSRSRSVDSEGSAASTRYERRRINDFLNQSLGINTGSVTVAIAITSGETGQSLGNDVASAGSGDICTITVSDSVSLIRAKSLSGATLSGDCSMRHL